MVTDYTPCCHSAWARDDPSDCSAVTCAKCVRVNNTGEPRRGTNNLEFCGLCGFIQVTDAEQVQTMEIHQHVRDCNVRRLYCTSPGVDNDRHYGYGETYVPCSWERPNHTRVLMY
jgi:hypothetical protein